MAAVEFAAWPKIARLNRDIIVTEKIDGTNAAIVIKPIAELDRIEIEGEARRFFDTDASHITALTDEYAIFVQSRKRFITPTDDNYGFASWVYRNRERLTALGPGTHYGEWWGQKIQRGYGMDHKAFSLFNTSRWGDHYDVMEFGIDGLDVVPVLYKGPFDQYWIEESLNSLRQSGSYAAFDQGVRTRPEAEGIVIFHTALNGSFKVTLKGDEAPKGAAGHALDEG